MTGTIALSPNVMFYGPGPGGPGPGGPGPGGGPGGFFGGPGGFGPGPGGPFGPHGPHGHGGGWFGRHGGPYGPRGPHGPYGPMGMGPYGPGPMGMGPYGPGPMGPIPHGPMGVSNGGPYGPYGPGPWGFGFGRGPGGCFGWGSLGHPRGWFGGWLGIFPARLWYPGHYIRRPVGPSATSKEFVNPPRKSLFARFRDWFAYNFWF